MNFLLQHIYGGDILKKQTLLSVLSLVCRKQKGDGNLLIVIYTDQPAPIKRILGNFVKVETLEKELFEKYRVYEDKKQRIKLHIIKDFLEHHYGNMLYADIDTFFYRSAQPLYDQIDAGNFVLKEGKSGGSPDTSLIGINTKQADLMQKVLKQYESLSELSPSEREKSAFSKVLSGKNLHHADESYMYHYGNNQEAVQSRIDEFVSQHFYRDMGELMQIVSGWDVKG